MKAREKNLLEWVVFLISLPLVLATVATLTYYALHDHDAPPEFRITLKEAVWQAEPPPGCYLVGFHIKNNGTKTAQDVHVVFDLEQDGRVLERGELTLPFVPRHSTREGAVTFQKDPRTANIRARILGFHQP